LRPFPVLRCEELEVRDTPATFSWTGGGADNNWSTGLNWAGGGAPTRAAGEGLGFSLGGARTANFKELAGASFNPRTISDSNYDITGNGITLPSSAASGVLAVATGAINNRIDLNISLGAAAGVNQTFTINANAALQINGSISGSTGSTLTKDGTG